MLLQWWPRHCKLMAAALYSQRSYGKQRTWGVGGGREVKVSKIPEGKDVFFSTVYSEHQSFLL